MTVSCREGCRYSCLGQPHFCLVTQLLAGCAGIPDGVQAVKGFDLNRYLGTWYEIARLDHSFERGLSRVQAEYTLRGRRWHQCDEHGVR
jgi:lipocalin